MIWRAILLLLALVGSDYAFTKAFSITTSISSAATIMPAYNQLTANWTKAGLIPIGGIPNRTTQCGTTVNPTGVTPPAYNDDAHAIQTAINNCTAGQVVKLGAGTFQLDRGETIQVNKSITLRGTGTCNNASSPYCSTVIQFYNGLWPTYVPNTQCGATTGTPPNGAAPGSLSACGFGQWAIITMGHLGDINWGNCQANNTTAGGCGVSLSADAAQGDTTIRVTSTSNFSVGMWFLIDESPQFVTTTNPLAARFQGGGSPPSATIHATPELFSASAVPVTQRTENIDSGCPYNYGFCPDRVTAEMHLITAIGAGPCPGVNCTLTFDSPLTTAYRISGGHDGRAYWPSKIITQAGVENLSVERALNIPVLFYACAYCWAKGVEQAYWVKGTDVIYSPRVQLEGNYFHDCGQCTNDGTEYPIAIDTASTEVLVENNISLFAGKGMVGRAATAAVIAYNYVDKTFYAMYSIGDYFLDMGLNGSHEGGTHHFLFEGNRAYNCDGDNTHGSASYHTFFRNHCAGFRTDFTDPSCNANYHCNGGTVPVTVSDVNNTCFNGYAFGGTGEPHDCSRLRPAGPMAYNYWYAFVGNVMGLAGQSTTAKGWIYSARTPGNRGTGFTKAMTDKSIWQSGWTGQDPQNCCNYVSDPWLDGTNSPQFLFTNGNYDYVTNSVADNAAGYSQNFPKSLYTNTQPSFFTGTSCTYPWPWVQPAAGTQLPNNSCGGAGLPAKARWDAGTPFVQP
jgi:hypothetical protein